MLVIAPVRSLLRLLTGRSGIVRSCSRASAVSTVNREIHRTAESFLELKSPDRHGTIELRNAIDDDRDFGTIKFDID